MKIVFKRTTPSYRNIQSTQQIMFEFSPTILKSVNFSSKYLIMKVRFTISRLVIKSSKINFFFFLESLNSRIVENIIISITKFNFASLK